MKRLLEMIDQVKLQNGIEMLDPVERLTRMEAGFKTDFFFRWIDQCQPFVFSPKNDSPEEIDGLEIWEREKIIDDDENYVREDIDAPFKVWSAEIAGDHFITVPRGRDKEDIFSVIAFMAVEDEPGRLFYFILTEWPDVEGKKRREVFMTVHFDEVAKELIKRLYTEKTGIEPGRTKVKVGKGKEKKFVQLKKVIHIRPKRLVSVNTKNEDGKEIDWSHRWTVRGCWVTLKPGRIGKDREGNYCVDGKTWRVEHIKGPDHLPVIKKTRLIEDV